MRVHVLTLFPEMFGSPLAAGVLRRARERGVLEISLHQLRDYAGGRHLQVDDTPYGGGQGMVMKPEPVVAAIEHITATDSPRRTRVPEILLSGDHTAIARWRREQSLRLTLERRPDLLTNAPLDGADRVFLRKLSWRDKEES